MGNLSKAKAAAGTAAALFNIGKTTVGAAKSPVMPTKNQYANRQSVSSSARLDSVRAATKNKNSRSSGSAGRK
jgi:hypothetical protein